MNTSAHPTQPFVLLDEGLIANTPDHDIAVLDLDTLTDELGCSNPNPAVLLEQLEMILNASTDPDANRRMNIAINNLLFTPEVPWDVVTQLAEAINDATTMDDEARIQAITMLENTDRERYSRARAVLTGVHESVSTSEDGAVTTGASEVKDGVRHKLLISHGFTPVFTHIITSDTMVEVRTYESTAPADTPPRDSLDLWMHQLMINLDNPEPFGATRPRTYSYTVVMGS